MILRSAAVRGSGLCSTVQALMSVPMDRALGRVVPDDLEVRCPLRVERPRGRFRLGLGVVGLLAGLHTSAAAQAVDPAGRDLSALDIDELARIKVTSVSRRPEAISQAHAAITVVSREDIRRSGAATLPEALRLLPGLSAARIGTRDWAISSRGSNQQSSNKMLVLVDGRVVYSPIFAGVFWDVQRVPLEDIDRIELIRGPGAALWGANAVNGVINVVTRPASESRGGFAALVLGTNDQAQLNLRYGSPLGSSGALRVYGMGSTEGASDRLGGESDIDDWQMAQGGFRADLPRGADQTFTLQGDIYTAEGGQRLQLATPVAPFIEVVEEDLTAHGGNLLGRWTRRFSAESDLAIQGYVDYAARSQPAQYGRIGVTTLELDFQHHFPLGRSQNLIWGLGYRRIIDDVTGAFSVRFDPAERAVDLVTGFVQDEIVLLPGQVALSVGSKFEHNDYTGFELQPTGRVLWTPTLSTSFWGAVSRAVRTPSRVDSDIRLVAQVFDGPPLTQVVLRGSDALEAEELVAYEIGYRASPDERLSLDIAGFYHQYHRLRSFLPLPPESSGDMAIRPFIVTNNARARAVGGTASAAIRVRPWWRMLASYTYLDEEGGLEADAPAGAIPEVNPGFDPRHQIRLWSSFDLPANLEFDVLARYVSRLAVEPQVEEYLQTDVKVGMRIGRKLHLAVIGRDLLTARHVEFPSMTRRAIERQLQASGSWTF
jgi:iron complex outermembrane receptor protein